MNEISDLLRQDYYRKASDWASDQREELRSSRRLAWIVAGIATVIALCEALALVFLAPLKTVVPYTLLVDRQTGYVQELKPLDAEKIAPDTALTRSFLVQYVIARESYDAASLQSNYRKVQLWSDGAVRSGYVGLMQASNPQSPLNLYPRTTVIDTQVKSVSPLGADSSLVRFETLRRDAGGQVQQPQAWVAVISYRYSSQPLSAADRFINPLGFQVVRYRRDQEAIAAAPYPVQAAPAQQAVPQPSVNGSPQPTGMIQVRPSNPGVQR